MMHPSYGRRLWFNLHTFAETEGNRFDQQLFFETWLSQVETSIGCASCFRKLKWFLCQWPTEYGENFALWAQCLHDFVNKELGKPLFIPELTLSPLMAKGIIR